MLDTELTPDSLKLFRYIAEEAQRFGDHPPIEDMRHMSQADNGNFTDLKKRGLIWVGEMYGKHWVMFTQEGIKLAASLGIEVDF